MKMRIIRDGSNFFNLDRRRRDLEYSNVKDDLNFEKCFYEKDEELFSIVVSLLKFCLFYLCFGMELVFVNF